MSDISRLEKIRNEFGGDASADLGVLWDYFGDLLDALIDMEKKEDVHLKEARLDETFAMAAIPTVKTHMSAEARALADLAARIAAIQEGDNYGNALPSSDDEGLSLRSAREEGYQAGCRIKAGNPYRKGTSVAKAWNRGLASAMTDDPPCPRSDI